MQIGDKVRLLEGHQKDCMGGLEVVGIADIGSQLYFGKDIKGIDGYCVKGWGQFIHKKYLEKA